MYTLTSSGVICLLAYMTRFSENIPQQIMMAHNISPLFTCGSMVPQGIKDGIMAEGTL